ncbi:MAG: hypothetical protein APR55_04445 [Methanolinea sp. SDB]|nr:MAG: hypothetical protein APR55_04445 [Methanolinea sp. SDB]
MSREDGAPAYTTTGGTKVSSDPKKPENVENTTFPFPEIKENIALNRNQEPARHGDPQIHDDQRHNRGHICELCPFAVSRVEHDMIQYPIFDITFRNLLEVKARAEGWKIKTKKRDTWIYQGALTFQLGHDTTIIYCSEPQDLTVIGEWVKHHFSPIVLDIDSLVYKVTHPSSISRDETTIEVTTESLKKVINSVIQPFKGRDGVLFLKSPNIITPAFKVYTRKDTQYLRCEFDARNQYQISSAYAMRHELLTILTKIPDHPGQFWEYLTKYYSLALCKKDFDDICSRLNDTLILLEDAARDIKIISKKLPSLGKNELLDHETVIASQIREFFKQDLDHDEDLDDLCPRVATFFAMPEKAILVLLTAAGIWKGKSYRRSVFPEEIHKHLIHRYGECFIGIDEIGKNIEILKEKGFFREHPDLEVYFSPTGTRFVKRLFERIRG